MVGLEEWSRTSLGKKGIGRAGRMLSGLDGAWGVSKGLVSGCLVGAHYGEGP